MKKQFLLFFLMLLPMLASADAVEINGIYYNLIDKAKQAEVTSNPNKYSGDIVIPENITYEGVEYSVTKIGNSAFSVCELTSVTIPNSVTSIGKYVFQSCDKLSVIEIPDNVKSIGELAFRYCRELKSVTIGKNVETIGKDAFSHCDALEKVVVIDIGKWCGIDFIGGANPLIIAHHLYNSEGEIKDLIIPSNVNIIGNSAFTGCEYLTSITIPNSVEKIGNYAFSGCINITSISIPNSVTHMGINTFAGCDALTSVKIGNGLTAIKEYSFSSCSALTSISFGENITVIEDCAFKNCTAIKSITIPNSVEFILHSSFEGCSNLTSLILGSGLKSIGSKTFSSCRSLENIYCYAPNAPNTWDNTFEDSFIEYVTLHVPETAINKYKLSDPWKNFKSIVAINGGGSESQKCANPTISYENGEISFNCNTEGVEYISEIKCDDIKKYYDSKIQLKATYSISVYATKSGYQNSDFVNATLCWIDKEPKTEGISNSVANVNARAVLIQSNGGNITIQGCDDGEQVSVYSINGEQLGYAISKNGQASVDTSIKQGSVAIVKMGNKSVKISIR